MGFFLPATILNSAFGVLRCFGERCFYMKRLICCLVLLSIVAGCSRESKKDVAAAIYLGHEIKYRGGDQWGNIRWGGPWGDHRKNPAARKRPDFCIEFADGKSFMISELTPEIIKTYYLEYENIDRRKFQKYFGADLYDFDFDNFDFRFDNGSKFRFKNGVLRECMISRPITKIGKSKTEKMYALPISKDEMIQIFGEPNFYRAHSPKRTFN